jgi:hypothetical protein
MQATARDVVHGRPAVRVASSERDREPIQAVAVVCELQAVLVWVNISENASW